MNKGFRGVFYGFISLLGLTFLVLFVVPRAIESKQAQRLIQERISNRLPGSVSWREFHFSLISSAFDLRDVQIRGPEGEQFASVGRLSFKLSLFRLFKRELFVSNLLLEKPQALFVIDERGNLPFVKAFMEIDEGHDRDYKQSYHFPFNLIVTSYRILDATALFNVYGRLISSSFSRITIEGRGNLYEKELYMDLDTGESYISFPRYGVELDQISMKMSLINQYADIEMFRVETADTVMLLSGSVDRAFSSPEVDAAVELDASLEEFSRTLHLDPKLDGMFKVFMCIRGAPGNPDLRLAIDYGGRGNSPQYAESIALRLGMRDRLVQIGELKGSTPQGSFRATGTVDLSNVFPDGFTSSFFKPDRLLYSTKIMGNNIDLGRVPIVKDYSNGTAQFVVSVIGEGMSLEKVNAAAELSIDAHADRGIFDRFPLDIALHTDIGIREGVVLINDMRSIVNGTHIRSFGIYDIYSERLDAGVSIDMSEANDLSSFLGIEGAAGMARLEASVRGTLRKPKINFLFEGRNLSYRDQNIGDVLLEASIDNRGSMEIRKLSLRKSESSIEANGSLQILEHGFTLHPDPPMEVFITLHSVDLNDIPIKEPPQGIMDGMVELRGSARNPTVKCALEISRLRFDKVYIGNLHIEELFYRERIIHMRNMQIVKNDSLIHLQGEFLLPEQFSYETLKDIALRINMKASPLYLEDFSAKYAGTLAAHAQIEGSISHPVGRMHISGSDIDLGFLKLKRASIESRIRPEGVWLDRFEGTFSAEEKFWGTGFATYQREFKFDLSSSDISLHHFDAMIGQEELQAKIHFRFSGNGTIDDPAVKGHVAIKELFVEGKRIDGFNLQLALQNNTATIMGRAVPTSGLSKTPPNARLPAPISLPAATNIFLDGLFKLRDKDFSISVQMRNTDLSPYFAIAGIEKLKGVVSGNIVAEGNIKHIKESIASAFFPSIHLTYGSYELLDAGKISATLKDKVFELKAPRLDLLNDGRLKITGKADLEGRLDFTVSGSVPFTVADIFVPGLEDITGDLSLNAHLQGHVAQPEMKGTVELREIAFIIPTLSQKVHKLNGMVHVTPQFLTIDSVEGMLDTGRFLIAGEVSLAGSDRFTSKLQVNTWSLPLHIPNTMSLLVQSKLFFSGGPEHTTARGEVFLLDGLYYRDVKLSLFQTVTLRKEEDESVMGYSFDLPYLRNMDLDLTVKRRNLFRVENNLAELSVNPDFRVMGQLADMVITGRAQVESGTVTYGRRNFEVKKGVIDFVNPLRTEPTFDIVGETMVRERVITLSISGKPDELIFRLTSIPPAEDAEILSLLVTGSPTQILADRITTSLEEDITLATRLDTFKTEISIKEEGILPEGMKVMLGKDLAARLSLEYSVESNDGLLTRSSSVTYKLLESTYISGFQDNYGRYGGAIHYRLEFR